MPKQFLSSLDVDAVLTKKGCQAVSERMPPDLFLYPEPLQRRPYIPVQNHLRLHRLFPVLQDGREQKLLVSAVGRRRPPCAEFRYHRQWNWERFVRSCSFGWPVDIAPNRVSHIDQPGIEVNIAPAQGDEFSAPESG